MAYERSEVDNMTGLIGEIDAEYTRKFLSDPRFNDMGGRTVLLSSQGGDVGQMLTLFEHIRHYNHDTFATGLNQSAAAVLFQAGNTRIMSRNAMLRFIPPPDNADIDPIRWHLHSVMVNLVRERTGMALAESYDLFDGMFISAERALQLGLTDKIEGREDDYADPNANFDWDKYDAEYGIDRITLGQGDRLRDSEGSSAPSQGPDLCGLDDGSGNLRVLPSTAE